MILFCASLIVIALSAATLGFGIVVLLAYFRTPAALRRKHVIEIAISYVCFIFAAIGELFDAIIHQESFTWHLTPFMFIGGVLGCLGLVGFIRKKATQ